MFGGKGLANTMADVPNREEEDKIRRNQDYRIGKEKDGYALYGYGVNFFVSTETLKTMLADLMRCETCKWYPKSTESCQNESVPGVVYPTKRFSCYHWEVKE